MGKKGLCLSYQKPIHPFFRKGKKKTKYKFQQFQLSIVDLLQLIRTRVEDWQMEITQLDPGIEPRDWDSDLGWNSGLGDWGK